MTATYEQTPVIDTAVSKARSWAPWIGLGLGILVIYMLSKGVRS